MTTDIADIVKGIVNQIVWPTPLFFQTGTRMAANQEWTMADSNLANKLPLVWLLETINEKFYGPQSTLERESELRIFFLDETDITQFYTEDHRTNVVQPMTDLAQKFMQVVLNTPAGRMVETYQIRTFSRFGVESQKGVIQNILDANLSGVELQLTLPVFKTYCCDC
jgi:hypothetical protein